MRQCTRYGLLFVVCFLLMNVTACHSRYSGASYSGYQTREAQSVQWGTIEAIDYITIKDQNTGLGAVGGAFAGGTLGSLMGRGHRGHVVGTVIGSLAGAVIGYGVEEAASTSHALEYTVRLESGELIAVVQAPDTTEAPFYVGDDVRILISPDGTTRIRP
ncbi:MAG: glycine zipper 2TM domain-containing protein [Pseudomonadota bacterium]